jgi:hypothetical protein
MRTIRINGMDVAVGLDWEPLPGASDAKKEAAKAAADARCRNGVIVKSMDETVVGLATSSGAAGLPSAAAWLAQGTAVDAVLAGGIVYVETLDNDEAWLCVIRRGVPTPGFDIVVRSQHLASKLLDIQSIGRLPVFSRSGEVPDSQARPFEDLLVDIDAPLIARVGGIAPRTLLIGTGAVVAIAAALGGYSFYEAYSARAVKAQALQSAAAAGEQVKAERARLEKLMVDRATTELGAKVLFLPSPKEQVAAWLSAVEDLPVTVAGWKLTRAECAADACTTTWTRSPISTVNEFLAAVGSNNWTLGRVQENEATVTFAVRAPNARTGTLDTVPESMPHFWNLTTQLQEALLAGVGYKLKAAEAIKVDLSEPGKPPAPGTPAAEIAARPIPWKAGVFEATGKRVFEIRDFPGYVDFDYVAVTSLAIEYEQTTWVLNGTYTIR